MSASLSPIAATINVAIGGAFGAALRYQLGRAMTVWLGSTPMTAFPFATLAVNTLGSMLMGVLAGWLLARGTGEGDQIRLLLGVGLLGGFTTFSAFSLELVLLVQRGQWQVAALYALMSIALGVFGLSAGFALMRATA